MLKDELAEIIYDNGARQFWLNGGTWCMCTEESSREMCKGTADRVIAAVENYLPLRVDGKPMELEGYKQAITTMIKITRMEYETLTYNGKRVEVTE